MADERTPLRWTDREGREWACSAYDHGPLCRRCQPVDEVLAAMLTNTEKGYMTVHTEADGSFSFAMTAAGTQAAGDILKTLAMEDDFDADS